MKYIIYICNTIIKKNITMEKFIVEYENTSGQFIMNERILVHAEDYRESLRKARIWLSNQKFTYGKILGSTLYYFRAEIK